MKSLTSSTGGASCLISSLEHSWKDTGISTSSSPPKSTSTTAGGINGTAGNGSIVMNQPIYPHPANLATTSGFQDSVATRTAAAAAAANTAGALNASLLV